MSNGIGKNPLNDISKVYLQQIANEGTMDIKGFAIPKSEQDAAKKRVQDKTKKKQMEKGISSAGYTKEGLDPVNPVAVKKKFANRKDRDLDNDGDTDSSDKYLHKRRKAIAGAMKKRMSEGVRDMDPEKGTAERKARLEKKRGMKLDDHPQYKKEEVEVDEAVKGQDTEMRKAGAAERRMGDKKLSVKQGEQNADKMQRDIKFFGKLTKKEEVEVVDEKINPALKGILKKTPKGEDPKKGGCLLYTSPSPRDQRGARMPSSA